MHCLIFTGGDFPKPHKVKHLLPQADFVIAADSGLQACELFGFSPNRILGDFDSVDKSLLDKYPPSILQQYNTEKDFSDTELALREAQNYNATQITLIGGGGGRLDHLLALIHLFSKDLRPNLWITGQEVSCLISKQKNPVFSCNNLLREDAISIFALQSNDALSSYKITSSGLYWELDSLVWQNGFCSLSNKIMPSFFEQQKAIQLEARRGTFLITIPLHCEPHLSF